MLPSVWKVKCNIVEKIRRFIILQSYRGLSNLTAKVVLRSAKLVK